MKLEDRPNGASSHTNVSSLSSNNASSLSNSSNYYTEIQGSLKERRSYEFNSDPRYRVHEAYGGNRPIRDAAFQRAVNLIVQAARELEERCNVDVVVLLARTEGEKNYRSYYFSEFTREDMEKYCAIFDTTAQTSLDYYHSKEILSSVGRMKSMLEALDDTNIDSPSPPNTPIPGSPVPEQARLDPLPLLQNPVASPISSPPTLDPVTPSPSARKSTEPRSLSTLSPSPFPSPSRPSTSTPLFVNSEGKGPVAEASYPSSLSPSSGETWFTHPLSFIHPQLIPIARGYNTVVQASIYQAWRIYKETRQMANLSVVLSDVELTASERLKITAQITHVVDACM
jgi:hypothetical protein